MGQTPETRTEARTETALVVETSVVHAGLGALVHAASGSATKPLGAHNKTAVAHFGENSATHARLEGTYTTSDPFTGEVLDSVPVDLSGVVEIGHTETFSNGFKIPQAVKDMVLFGLLGALRKDAHAKVMGILEARADGSLSKADADAAFMDAFNLSPAAVEAGKKHLAERRKVMGTRSPKVSVKGFTDASSE